MSKPGTQMSSDVRVAMVAGVVAIVCALITAWVTLSVKRAELTAHAERLDEVMREAQSATSESKAYLEKLRSQPPAIHGLEIFECPAGVEVAKCKCPADYQRVELAGSDSPSLNHGSPKVASRILCFR